ncbi:MAG TPA: hypothetical protein VNK95_25325 [Caldilineaceae bacterium]|nr:hypothetical protein [Caldilineaceae bacterium]
MEQVNTPAFIRRFGFVAVVSLALAAATGVLLRFGLVAGFPTWAQNYNAVRHAHSHLMYFGWVTVALMALIWHYLPILTGRRLPRGAGAQMTASAFLALLSYPAFWSNGYGLTNVAGRDLPLGSITAGLNGLGWFLFVGLYVRATWRLPARPLPVQLWDWGLILLVVSSLGAFGIAATVALDLSSPLLQEAFLHLFLDLFAVGWFSLGLLGVLWAGLARQGPLPEGLPSQWLAVALTPTFVLGMSPVVVTPPMLWLAALANGVAAALLARHLAALWQRRHALPRLVWFAGAALAVYLGATLLALWPGLWRWAAGTQLRVFILHLFLLGWVSSGLLATLTAATGQARAGRQRVAGIVWMVGVTAMLVALAGLGLAAVIPVRPSFWLWAAAWASLLPTAVGVWTMLIWRPRRTQG